MTAGKVLSLALLVCAAACSGPKEALTEATASAAPAAILPADRPTGHATAPAPTAPVAPSLTPSASAAPPVTSPSAKPQGRCPDDDPTFTPTGEYSRKRTRLFVQSQGSPRHAASDVVFPVGGAAAVEGKFTYGKARKDLEHEEISLFIRDADCAWLSVGTGFTNDDGWVRIEIPETLVTAPSARAFQLVVRGDGSRAKGTLWAVRPGTAAVVFDVDATLTTSDAALFDELLEGTVPEPRPNGSALAAALAGRDVLVVYLTGRPYFLGPLTRAWLESHGFPEGVVRTTKRLSDSAPTDRGVGAYKEAALRDLKGAGLDVRLAYGNAPTDICAYARGGIDPRRTFILGPHGGEGCDGYPATRALAGYIDHVSKVAELVP